MFFHSIACNHGERIMKIANGLAAALAVLLLSGCAHSRMAFRDLDGDIPSPLVARYAASDRAYADEGATLLFPVLHANEYVAKTGAGFQAARKTGLLFGLLLASDKMSHFDPVGQLLEYTGRGWVLTGLVAHYRVDLRRAGGVARESGGWSVLWGAVGYRERPDGERTLTLLWIPIPLP